MDAAGNVRAGARHWVWPALRWALQREHALTPLLLGVAMLACWAYLLSGAGTLQDMGGMQMPMSVWPWTPMHALLMLAMWLVMMAAMMLPAAAPVILLYGSLAARMQAGSAAALMFAGGYLAAWSGFSLAATGLQFALEAAGWLTPMMEAGSDRLAAGILLAAGIYQWLPAKSACLDHCRSPLETLAAHWRPGRRGAFAMGARHGAYCLGCCWGLMLLLFVGGLMNMAWIAGLALLVLIEKLAPAGRLTARLAGAGLTAWGILLLARQAGAMPGMG
ncbi:Predicted metal-binding membrane protein [Noviherbaspirillum humi]|uniref:Predicted metal-binding membrane protein n=1 Tax=Noviherbaspirillum humi TaxID=1688639 RepID=A0A239L021_9BURK|nr:DUF2182 domain-containing protein [Noviherbaspirillum humi]SNT23079.1 Predicted metal-binding membrane protein [Noviherbaspirillum humi]